MSDQRVHLQREDDIPVFVIDNPPINAGSVAVREGLLAAIEILRTDPGLQAAVLIGAGTTPSSGPANVARQPCRPIWTNWPR